MPITSLSESHDSLPTLACDVLVIGGGPAGSTISALLAERGWNVCVLEKDSHPRFHIGESLLPQSIPMLKQLGVLPEVEKIGIIKYGAQMVSHRYGRSQMFYFAQAFDESQPYAFEVKRSEFDAILANNAAAKGAHWYEGVRAQRVEFRSGQTSLIRVNSPLPVDWSRVTVIRNWLVVTGCGKATASCSWVFPVTVASVVPSALCTVKSCGTPSALNCKVMPGSVTADGVVRVSTSG